MTVIIVKEPLPVYGNSQWNVDIHIAPNGVSADFSNYDEIVVTWRVQEYNDINKMILDSPRDENSQGVIKIRATAEQAKKMQSGGVLDIFGDDVAILKAHTTWEPSVK